MSKALAAKALGDSEETVSVRKKAVDSFRPLKI